MRKNGDSVENRKFFSIRGI